MLYQIAASLPWFAWIAIIGIVCGCVSSTSYAWFKHRERMALIAQGINPDSDEPLVPGRDRKTSYPEL
jgi:hypothetical protein